MTLSAADAILWVERLIAMAIVLQTAEYLLVSQAWGEQGIWRWSVLRREFDFLPGFLRRLLDLCLGDPGFMILLWLRIAAALGLAFFPSFGLAFFLLSSNVLISLRWRGTYNGGSDFMTFTVLLSLCIATASGATSACLWLIAGQTCATYVIAGLVKIKRESWRDGSALAGFLGTTIYRENAFLRSLVGQPALMMAGSWSVMLLECAFPLALVDSRASTAFIGAALLFHLANFYVFGLNRFVWAWAATYPAIFYCSQRL